MSLHNLRWCSFFSSFSYRLIAGTCSTKTANSIHVIEYSEDTNQIRELYQFPHADPVQQIVTSPFYDDKYIVLATDTSSTISNAKSSSLSFNKVTMYSLIAGQAGLLPSKTPVVSASFNIPSEISLHYPPKRTSYLKSSSATSKSEFSGSEVGYDAVLFNTLYGQPVTQKKDVKAGSAVDGVPGVSLVSPIAVLWDNDFSSSTPSNRVCLVFAFGAALYDISQVSTSNPTVNAISVVLFDHHLPVTSSAVCWDVFSPTPYTHIYTGHGADVCHWALVEEKSISAKSDVNAPSIVLARRVTAKTVVSAAHDAITSLDVNLNKPHHIATAGSDGEIKIWDLRRKTLSFLPVCVLRSHVYPVLKVLFNSTHDQLIISSGMDNKVNLWGTPSVSSLPTSTLTDLDPNQKQRSISNDANQLLQSYEGLHQEAINGICWTRKGSWHFFSISFDGRIVVSNVPPTVKYRILL